MEKKIIIILLGIFVLAYALRVLYLPKNSLTFGYDQARDAIISQSILKGDIKIQGPPASTAGLYHGVFYYYLLAPAYLLGGGSPISAAYWVALLNSLTVFIVFYLGYLMTKKAWVGILATFLFAISFEATQYATWLSNPTIGVWTVPLFYLGLWLWTQRKNKFGPLLAAIGLGLSIQAEIFLAYHFIPLIIWLWLSRKNITKKQLLVFSFSFLVVISTMILCEFKFGFKSVEGIRALALGEGGNLAYARSIGDYLLLYLNQIGRIFAFNSYPGNIGWGGAAVLILGIYSLLKKDRLGIFLALWLFAHLWVVTVGGTSTPFLMVGIGPAVSLTLAYYLTKLKSKAVLVVLVLILVYGNISSFFRENPKGATLFAIQKDMLLTKELSVIDFTYQEAKGEEFSINTLTSPLYINLVWSYLYKWYGLPRYGYLPTFHGRDQVGQIDSLDQSAKPKEVSFLIIEPMGGIPPQYLDLTLGEEDAKTKLLAEKSFGELRVQKRALK